MQPTDPSPSTSTGERRAEEMTMTQSETLTARIDETLKATEGHTEGLTMRVENDETDGDDLGYGVVQFPWRIHVSAGQDLIIETGALGNSMTHEDAALIASAPTLRALLVEARAQLAAQAEALAAVRGALGAVLDEAYDGQHSYRVDLSTLRAAYDALGAQS